MSGNEVVSGYLDVKVSARSRRGFTPWKAWHKQWCEIKRLDSVENGAKLILKTAADGSIINSVTLPRSSTVCRIESTTKNFAFGVFTLGRNQKPILFLSGSCEKDTQKWMSLIRKALAIASYLPVGSLNFHISLVDNDHSRAARLTGLFGILSVTCKKYASRICIGCRTNIPFCEDASELLEVLVTHGKSRKLNPLFAATQRLSQSESDLSKSNDGYHSLRHFSNSDDSGVRVSISSDDSDSRVKTKTLSMNGLLSKTPGGSEAEDDDTESNFNTQLYNKSRIPRGESGISLASGVYEEIPEFVPDLKTNTPCNVYSNGHMMHLYEDPEELSTSILLKTGKCIPPPLPPRIYSKLENNCDIDKMKNISTPECLLKSFSGNACNLQKFRSHTLPAKDLRRLSQTFSSDSDYMVMTPKNKKKCKNNMSESVYVPMSPITSLKTKLENCYMVMSGKKC